MAAPRQASTVTFLGLPGVPQLGLGLAALGRPGYINLGHGSDLQHKAVDDMRAHCWGVLDAAWAAGIRYFDAARSYGRAEEFLAGWLAARGIKPEDTLAGSKWGYYYTADWQVDTNGSPHEVKLHTAANLAKQSAESEALLGGCLHLYQIHSATLESGVLEAADVLSGLEALKRRNGWRVGLSLSGVQQAETLRKAMQVRMSDGAPLFDCVQATWNLLEQSAGGALAEARQAGMDVIVKEAMANGRLTERNGSPGFAPRLAALKAAAAELGTTVDALALAAVMAQPFQPMVLSGAGTAEQVKSNAASLELVHRLSPEALSALMGAMRQDAAEYWAERSALAWN